MKKIIVLGTVLILILFLFTSCGVPQEEHDAVLAERDAAQAEVVSLQSELAGVQSDLATTQSDLEVAESDLATAESAASSARSDLATARRDLATAESELATAQSDLTEAESETLALEALYSPSYDKTVAVDTFSGTWKGTLSLPGRSSEFELRIQGNSAWVVFSSGERPLTMVRLGPNLVLYFMSQGGIWTETQVYTLASLTKDSVQILYTRQVHNEGSTTWSLQGSGVLKRQ